MNLHALPDDFRLTALADTERDAGRDFRFPYYLTDPDGNKLTDPDGNYLIVAVAETLYPQILNAFPDDFRLVAAEFSMNLYARADDFRLNAE